MKQPSPERWRRIEELIDAALDRPTDEREAFLHAACGDDRALYDDVIALYRAAEDPRSTLDTPAMAFAADLVARAGSESRPDRIPPHRRVGPYRIVRELGRGGMGTVYLAEREEHFQQRVALKVIRHGLHLDDELVRRFVEERQIVASLEHPSIARLLDGGVTSDGVPWFAMELVDGEPVSRACDERRLPIEARLELFCTICNAVDYAHQRGIIHRDIKPSNILMRADGAVKLLDFGVAKLVVPDESAGATLTRTGTRIFTPEYASPEQVRGLAVTAASDVYSLGVLLYALLAGRRPYRITGRTTSEIERAVLDQTPTRPSNAVRRHEGGDAPAASDASPLPEGALPGAATPSATQIARARSSTPDRLADRLRGELDTIVLKALAKEPAHRYASVAALSHDIRNHLEGVPVALARRPRWRTVVATAGAAALVLAAGAGVQWIRSRGETPAVRVTEPIIAIGLISDYRTERTTELGHSLSDLLATNLARVPGLRAISTARLNELMAQLGGSVSDAGAYSSAARRAGATVLIEGSIYSSDSGRMRLDLRKIDLTSGGLLGAETVYGHTLFALVDSGTARLAMQAGSTGPTGSVADVTTHSEVAYRFYEEGVRTYYRGDLRSANGLFAAAVAADSGLAMAWYYLARTTSNYAIAREHVDRAVRLAERASDRERLIIKAAAQLGNSDPATVATAETLSVRYPESIEGDLFAGRAMFAAGDYAGSLRHLRRVLAADSTARRSAGDGVVCGVCDARADIINAYVALDSAAAVLREARQWTVIEPNRTAPWLVLASTLMEFGERQAARDAWARAAAIDASLDGEPAFYGHYYVRGGEFETADAALREIMGTGSPLRRVSAGWYLAISLRTQGRIAEALEVGRAQRLAEARLNPGVVPVQFALQHAHILHELGRHVESKALFDSVSRAYAGFPRSFAARYRTWSLALGATALAAARDTIALAARIDSVRALGAQSLLARDQRMHHHLRGLLLAARGDDAGAVAEFRKAVTSLRFGYSRTNYELARALSRLGRPAEAIQVLRPALHEIEASGLYVTQTEIRELLAQQFEAVGQRDSAAVYYEWVANAWRDPDPPFQRRRDAARAKLTTLSTADPRSR